MANYNGKDLIEKVPIVTENSRKWQLERNEHNEGVAVLLINWIKKLS